MKSLFLLLLVTAFYRPQPPRVTASCGVEEPLEDIAWLKDKVAQYRKESGSLTIMQAQRGGETIFSIEHVLGADARTTTYYRCNGWEICQTSVTIAGLTSGCLGNFPSELTERKMIYPEVRMK